jgi:predicted permease
MGIADQLHASVASTVAVSLVMSIVTLPLIIHLTS